MQTKTKVLIGAVAVLSIIGLNVANRAATKGSPEAQAEILKLETLEQDLNGKCRDGRGPDHGASACKGRDSLLGQLTTLGVCWGHDGQIEADKGWQTCGAAIADNPSQKRSTLYDLANPEPASAPGADAIEEVTASPPANDAVSYDLRREAAKEVQLIQEGVAARCTKNQVTVALRAGMRSRQQISEYAASHCAHYFQLAKPSLPIEVAAINARQAALLAIDSIASRGQ